METKHKASRLPFYYVKNEQAWRHTTAPVHSSSRTAMDNYGKECVQMNQPTTYFQKLNEIEWKIRKTILIRNSLGQLIDNVLICREDSVCVTWHVALSFSVYFNFGTFIKNSKDSTNRQTKRNKETTQEAVESAKTSPEGGSLLRGERKEGQTCVQSLQLPCLFV